jgi:predicted nucleic-acid-binding Zn-ribbon protein
VKTGHCPKCGSDEVYSGATLPLKKGPFGSNSIPVTLTSIAALDNYVCHRCGYIESYISDADKLAEISSKWVKVKPEENAKTEKSSE